jgi:hypothetical protein
MAAFGQTMSHIEQKGHPGVLMKADVGPTSVFESEEETTIRRLADYERLSGIFWIVLGILLCLTIIGAIAGVWNILAGRSGLGLAKRIRERDPGVPSEYEGTTGLIVIGLVNLFLGGAIGILFVAFDFYVRDQVLKNKHLFTGRAPTGLFRPSSYQELDQQLRSFTRLRDEGLLKSDEFEAKSKEILARPLARANSPSQIEEHLRVLAKLKDEGIIDESDFERKRREVLGI